MVDGPYYYASSKSFTNIDLIFMGWLIGDDFPDLPGHQVYQLVHQKGGWDGLDTSCWDPDELPADGAPEHGEDDGSGKIIHLRLFPCLTWSQARGHLWLWFFVSTEYRRCGSTGAAWGNAPQHQTYLRKLWLHHHTILTTQHSLTKTRGTGKEGLVKIFIIDGDSLDQRAANRVSEFSPGSKTKCWDYSTMTDTNPSWLRKSSMEPILLVLSSKEL